jgi:hypothetical protein
VVNVQGKNAGRRQRHARDGRLQDQLHGSNDVSRAGDFHMPRQSSGSQLLEAKHDMQRMLVEIPLTDDERAAVESDRHSVVRLIELLAGVATSAGPMPRQISQDTDRAGGQTPDPEGPSQP